MEGILLLTHGPRFKSLFFETNEEYFEDPRKNREGNKEKFSSEKLGQLDRHM